MPTRTEVGDLFEVPTKRGMRYVQCVHKSKFYNTSITTIRAIKGFYLKRPTDILHLLQQPEQIFLGCSINKAYNAKIIERVGNFPTFNRTPPLGIELPYFDSYRVDRKSLMLPHAPPVTELIHLLDDNFLPSIVDEAEEREQKNSFSILFILLREIRMFLRRKTMFLRKVEVKVGDFFEITTFKNRRYFQVVYQVPYCSIIRVTSKAYKRRPADLGRAVREKEQFVCCFLLKRAIAKGEVCKVGNFPIPSHFSLPPMETPTFTDNELFDSIHRDYDRLIADLEGEYESKFWKDPTIWYLE